MITRKLAGAVVALALTAFGVLATASPVQANSELPAVSKTSVECGIDLTFSNPTKWLFSFDYRVDNQDASADVEPELADLLIKEGPLKGEGFGPRYQVVTLLGGASDTAEIRFDTAGTHTVAYQLRRGAEQNWFIPWATETVDVPESCVPAPPSPTPTPSATEEPPATESPEPTPTETDEPTPSATPSTSGDPSESPEPVPSVSTSPASGAGGSDGGGLPLTGASVLGFAGGGLLLLAAGGIALVLARRRREPDFTA